MTVLLRMRAACFHARNGDYGPVTSSVRHGERAALVCRSAREAAAVARMAAGIVKASTGHVLIEEFDPRAQSAHCKRIAAFVPHAPVPIEESEFERYVVYRAALWNVDPRRAIAHARLLMERLSEMHEAFAYPLVGALIANPKLLVLDRPEPVYAQLITEAVGSRALFSTHLDAAAARAFGPPAGEVLRV